MLLELESEFMSVIPLGCILRQFNQMNLPMVDSASLKVICVRRWLFNYSNGTHILRIIGQFIAKAMLDSRTIDLSLNKIFLKLVLDEEVPLTIASLRVSNSYSCQVTLNWLSV